MSTMTWQPMATAPEHRWVLVGHSRWEMPIVAKRIGDRWQDDDGDHVETPERWCDTPAMPEPAEWVVFDARSGLFWGPDETGYAGLWGAGLYTESHARRIASNPDRQDRAHHITEYRDQIANMCGAFERLSARLKAAQKRRRP